MTLLSLKLEKEILLSKKDVLINYLDVISHSSTPVHKDKDIDNVFNQLMNIITSISNIELTIANATHNIVVEYGDETISLLSLMNIVSSYKERIKVINNIIDWSKPLLFCLDMVKRREEIEDKLFTIENKVNTIEAVINIETVEEKEDQ